MRFAFIAAKKAEHKITILCRCMRVGRSGFYAWARRGPSARAPRDLVRFSTAPTPIILSYEEERRTKRPALINLSTDSDQVHRSLQHASSSRTSKRFYE